MAYLSLIGLTVIGVAIYDAAVADKKQRIADHKRRCAVENCGILHGKLTGGKT